MHDRTKLTRGVAYQGGGFLSPRWFVWDGRPPRVPLEGEWYLSGAIIQAYEAQKGMVGEYCIAVEVEMVTCAACEGEGKIPLPKR